MFCHKNLLLARYKEAHDKPFVIIDKQTLKPVDEQVEAPFGGHEENKESLTWTPLETEYQEDTENGNRWFRNAPFCSDGEYIYTLVHYKQ